MYLPFPAQMNLESVRLAKRIVSRVLVMLRPALLASLALFSTLIQLARLNAETMVSLLSLRLRQQKMASVRSVRLRASPVMVQWIDAPLALQTFCFTMVHVSITALTNTRPITPLSTNVFW
jgi:hypothetical protein